MSRRPIVGKNLTGNHGNEVTGTGFASEPSRNLSLESLFPADPTTGSAGDYDFFGEDTEQDPHIEDKVSLFNSRLDLAHDLPSTRRVSRYNAQNKG